MTILLSGCFPETLRKSQNFIKITIDFSVEKYDISSLLVDGLQIISYQILDIDMIQCVVFKMWPSVFWDLMK